MAKAKKKKDVISVQSSYPHFVTRVKAELDRRNIDFVALLARTQLSRPTLRRLLAGEGNPLLSNLLDISQAIGLPLVELLGPQQGVAQREFRSPESALLGAPPVGDPTAYWVYKELCLGRNEDDLARELELGSFPNPAETGKDAIFRAVLDVFHNHQAWIHAAHVPRNRPLEDRIATRFKLPERLELEDRVPVRVIDIPETSHKIIRISAIAAVAASITRELMLRYRTLGIGDGFSSAMWQHFLRRGALSRIELLPLVVTPRFTQYEQSSNAIVASMMRTHLGYWVGSTIELEALKVRLQGVDHAVISCGPGHAEPSSRLPRLVKESTVDSAEFFQRLAKEQVVGDLLYHFLRADGSELEMPDMTGDLSKIERKDLRGGKAVIFSTPIERLAGIAERGVTLLQSHQSDRAPVIAAALSIRPRPINFLVITRGIAERLLARGTKGAVERA